MDLLSLSDIKELKANEKEICVSILIPTHRGGMETYNGKDSLQLKTELQDISNRLQKDYGYNKKQAEDLLKPAFDLVEDSYFWRNQSDGLAVYISQGFFKYYSLPIQLGPRHHVMNEFMIAPIVGLLNKNDFFYILQISRDNVHLYDASRYSITQIDLSHLELPKDYEDIINMKNPDRTLQQHSGNRGQESIFHGQGASKDDEENKELLLFRLINRELDKVFNNQTQQLLLAGVDSVVGEFKKHIKYNNVLNQSIRGNYEQEDPKMLHERAMAIMSPILNKKKAEKLNELYNDTSSHKTTNEFKDIVEGAMYEKVEQLFFKSKACPTWGIMQSKNGDPATAEIHKDYQQGDICLVNRAVVDTLLNKGEVYQLSSFDEPDIEHSMAARFRFE